MNDLSYPVLRVESLGGGLQSSAMVEMVVEGVLPELDAVIFADTGGEMDATYAHVDYLRGRLATVGIPLITVTAGNLAEDIETRAGRGMQPNPPVRVLKASGELARINSYNCSYDYKRRVVEAQVKRLCGARGAWKRTTVDQWIGYSTDEGSRVKQPDGCRCGHRRLAHYNGACQARINRDKPGECAANCAVFDPWQVNSFPLIELGMRRGDVTNWLRERGLPIPPRSACYFCPNRGNGHWRDLRDNHPEKWDRTVRLDRFVRTGLNGLDGEGFLHQSGVALEEADLRSAAQINAEDNGQDGLFDEGALAYDCDAGVCFT